MVYGRRAPEATEYPFSARLQSCACSPFTRLHQPAWVVNSSQTSELFCELFTSRGVWLKVGLGFKVGVEVEVGRGLQVGVGV